ncbi:MAG TPA: hypothetical protein VGL99_17250 [Chloroflexota bacterium]
MRRGQAIGRGRSLFNRHVLAVDQDNPDISQPTRPRVVADGQAMSCVDFGDTLIWQIDCSFERRLGRVAVPRPRRHARAYRVQTPMFLVSAPEVGTQPPEPSCGGTLSAAQL